MRSPLHRLGIVLAAWACVTLGGCGGDSTSDTTSISTGQENSAAQAGSNGTSPSQSAAANPAQASGSDTANVDDVASGPLLPPVIHSAD